MEGICETGPTVYRPYPRSLAICGFNYKGSTFYFLLSYFKTLSVGPAGVELTTFRVQPDVQPTEPAVRGESMACFLIKQGDKSRRIPFLEF